jgi:hypothetical protein
VEGLENCFVLAPTAFVDRDDDANPMLKSWVLNSFAAESVVGLCWRGQRAATTRRAERSNIGLAISARGICSNPQPSVMESPSGTSPLCFEPFVEGSAAIPVDFE